MGEEQGGGLPLAGGGYRTAEPGGGRESSVFPTAGFYRRFLAIVVRNAGVASRGKYGSREWSASSLDVLRALEAVDVRIEVDGAGNFCGLGGPCVFVGNHMSSLEAFVLPSIIQPRKKFTFVVKRSLVEYPVFGHIMRARDPIVVGRSNPRDDLKAVLEGGVRRLAEGVSIVVFPQTTRTVTFDPGAFNTIGVKLAKRAGVPIVPLALKTDAWANGRLVKDFGKVDPSKAVHFSFGEPLRVQGTGAEEHRKVISFIREKLLAWGGAVVVSAAPAAQ